MGKYADDFEVDLQDPVLLKDIELDKHKLAFLEVNAEKCFLCKWMLEDYQKNNTFTGVKQEGPLGKLEIFPIRGEINHLWLELYAKPYPFKRKVTEEESRVHGHEPPPPPLVRPGEKAPEVAPTPPPEPERPATTPAPEQKRLADLPLSRPRKKP